MSPLFQDSEMLLVKEQEVTRDYFLKMLLCLHPRVNCLKRHGTGEEESLPKAAVQVLDIGQLMLHFHSLGNDLEIQAPGQSNDVRDDLLIVSFRRKLVDKTAVDLERTDREQLQVAQR